MREISKKISLLEIKAARLKVQEVRSAVAEFTGNTKFTDDVSMKEIDDIIQDRGIELEARETTRKDIEKSGQLLEDEIEENPNAAIEELEAILAAKRIDGEGAQQSCKI